jgi:hypothetical protein
MIHEAAWRRLARDLKDIALRQKDKKERTRALALADAKSNITQAGKRMAGRICGMLRNESGRLLDQFVILDGELSELEIEEILWEEFFKELSEKHGKP